MAPDGNHRSWEATPGAKPLIEMMANSLLGGVISEGSLPPGSVVDAGAWKGDFALWCAKLSRRVVHAIDPTEKNVRFLERLAQRGGLSDLVQATHGGLGSVLQTIQVQRQVNQQARGVVGQQLHNLHLRAVTNTNASAGERRRGRNDAFTVWPLDALFAERWPNESLALAHLDVEGAELSALRGAEHTIARDQPFILTELTVHRDAEYTRALMGWLDERGYDTFLIEELTGYPRMDIRNVLSLPRSRRERWLHSNALDLALAARAMHPVDATTVFHHAFPCCRPGGACCKRPEAASCCRDREVRRWVSQTMREWLELNQTEQRQRSRIDPRLFSRSAFGRAPHTGVPHGWHDWGGPRRRRRVTNGV